MGVGRILAKIDADSSNWIYSVIPMNSVFF